MGLEDDSRISRVLASIVDFSDDAIITKTLDGHITSWNRGAEKIFGYSADEVIGKHITILFPPERLDEEPRILESIRNGHIVDHYETERVRKDGSIVHLSLIISATRDANGQIIGILKVGRDITIKRRTEEVESRMADIIRLSDDAIYTKSLQGVITTWNAGAEKIFGYTRQEAIGKNVKMLIPQGRWDEEPMIIQRVSQGESIEHYETERVSKSGKIINMSLSVSPVKGSTGGVTGVLLVGRDITHKRKEAELQNWLASIINFSDDAIISKTLEGFITSWNIGAERIFGYSAGEVIGKHVSILIPAGRIDEEPEIIRKVSSGQYIDHYVTQRRRKDGSIVDISLTVSPVKDAEGRIVGVSKIARDITQQKRADEAIRVLNRELEAFSYTVAHDLRSPLRSVLSYSEMLLNRHGALIPEDGRQMLDRIIRQSQRMDILIRDILALSQLGAQALQKTQVDMEALAKEAVEEARVHYAGRSITITLKPIPPVHGDRSVLKQVWANLIGNAVKYSRHKAETSIEVGSTAADEGTIYYVKDNGIGFDMTYAAQVFKAFQRLHNHKEYEGTGVGLAIVEQIVVKHGGRVWAEAQPGEGATFFFLLPN